MASTAVPQDDLQIFTGNDRMGLTFFMAFLAHMIIILGITFALPKLRSLDGLPTLEITLVQTQSDVSPDKANYLAQANQDGGGDTEKPMIARNPLPIQEIGEPNKNIPSYQALPQKAVKSEKEITKLMVLELAKIKIIQSDVKPEKKAEVNTIAQPGIVSRQSIEEERTRLNAEISRVWEEYQQRPKRTFINARTREYKYALYMDAWRAKVERVGNLNYPEKARRSSLSGNLVLDVALNPDGTIYKLDIRRSSGHKLLDDAALRIVSLSAPFAPFPKNIRTETDILHITRTWKFNEDGWTR